MNAALLLEHYARIADASDAITRLRRFVLDLAVRGKLVEQDAIDEPAAELLKRIAAEGARLAKAGRIKRRAELPEVSADEAPSAIPSTWKWVRFAQIAEFHAGRTPARKDDRFWNTGDHAWVSIADMEDGGSIEITKETVSDLAKDKVFKAEPEAIGTIIMSFKLTIGKIARLATPAFHNEAIIAIHPHLPELDDYLFMALPELARSGKIKGAIKGATLNRDSLSNILVPLPPLAEQHRIVAKVDELMALCDQLEAARESREVERDKLTAASLARLNAPDPETFPADAHFALANLAPLTTRADQIKNLRQTILRLALAGKLTEREPTDHPASKLLAAIEERRSALLNSGYPNSKEAHTQLRKVAQQSLPNELAVLPHGWEYATLQQCALMVIDCKNKTAPYAADGVRLIRTTNVRDGKLNSIDQRYVSPETYEIWSARAKPEPGDILITREAPMGEVCLIPSDTMICLGQRMMLARLVPDTISPRFMLYSLMDPDLMERVQDKPIGMTVQHLRVGGVETLVVPLPPLAEQHRIVAKLDELMDLCDQLEASLTEGEQTRSRLLEAVLHNALEPA